MGWSWVNVRFGSKCDIGRRPDYVTFAPESDLGNGPWRGALPAARETNTVAALHHSLTQPQALRRPRAAAQAPPPAVAPTLHPATSREAFSAAGWSG